ncbi:diacylglycerol O-acyltransferase [Skeletonema marinoi]|uniref:diacylglycerol O-acyltransferase n=1 Tax=Skeletonema marinoi TaxID=267567 RepID=A0AAD8XVR7_9STRA|nr:diacylglycerol O-acyltransferase [Skeletonema marinoi]
MTLISQSCAYCDSEEFAIQQQFKKEEEEALLRSPNKKRGTLPNLIFETPTVPLRSMPSGRNLTKMGKSPSGRNLTKMGKSYMKKSDQYPPSKPMHRQASPSYLSDGAHPQNYRACSITYYHFGISNFRLLLDTVSKHGFILDELRFSLQGFSEGFSEAPLDNFPFVSGVEQGMGVNVVGMLLHFINTNATLVVVIMIVWLVMQATITWMKFISYNHANSDYRQNLATHKATLALVKDLDEEGLQISYPMNITLKNIYYFWFAPTLTYQIAFPRTPYIRWGKVVTHTLHLFISATLVAFLAAQVVAPNLDLLIKDLEANKGNLVAMLLYTIDYWEHNQEMVEVIEEKTPKLLATIASIFGASSKL